MNGCLVLKAAGLCPGVKICRNTHRSQCSELHYIFSVSYNNGNVIPAVHF